MKQSGCSRPSGFDHHVVGTMSEACGFRVLLPVPEVAERFIAAQIAAIV
jgi:hypothetical protein